MITCEDMAVEVHEVLRFLEVDRGPGNVLPIHGAGPEDGMDDLHGQVHLAVRIIDVHGMPLESDAGRSGYQEAPVFRKRQFNRPAE